MPRGEGQKNISQKVVDAIIAVKTINRDYGAKQIIEEIKQNKKAYHVNGDKLPAEGSVYKILRDNKKEVDIGQVKTRYVPSELDKPWTVGSCLKYNIHPAMIPILIEVQQVEKEPSKYSHTGDILTIRECRWIAFLFQAVNASEILKNEWEPKLLKGHVSIMAAMYAKREQIAEVMHQPIDTSDLDTFFSNNDVDLVKLWLETFDPEQYEKDKEAMNTFEPLRLDVLASILGMNELTQSQVDIFNEWLYNQFLSQIEPGKALEADKLLLAQHPEIQPIIDSWFKWIEANGKEDILNG